MGGEAASKNHDKEFDQEIGRNGGEATSDSHRAAGRGAGKEATALTRHETDKPPRESRLFRVRRPAKGERANGRKRIAG
nr:general stress protein [Paenibacillus sp. UNC496MF]